MCTVTYLPYKDKIYITANRDEEITRPRALNPIVAELASGKILYPKDVKKGGTWISIHDNGNAMVLMNGAFIPHISKPNYRKSRGLIFLEIFDSENPVNKFNEVDLDDIEPFTLIVWLNHNNTLWRLTWDEYEKSIESLKADVPHIWSSVTLYDDEMIAQRQKWFDDFRKANKNKITGEKIRDFHEHGGEGDDRINLNLKRGGRRRTLSITSIEISEERSVMYHHDLISGEQTINGWLFADNENH
ncbi:MAG: NRDE family protein [Flavipsychrobacter sp.]